MCQESVFAGMSTYLEMGWNEMRKPQRQEKRQNAVNMYGKSDKISKQEQRKKSWPVGEEKKKNKYRRNKKLVK